MISTNVISQSTVKLAAQLIFSSFLMGFCSFQLLKNNPSNEALYWGGISSTIAYWLPSPTDGTKKDEE
ncbi:hypothetical protein BZZ01_04740 [Nostocales cyanobacterium HT-58-2]|nr:hypothetical protein BZZ01_04740 [Nostocales cyanobacterium HT-58-2]